jgi:phosphoribosylaminoimidazolecarboxamide formyltransferase/IMP cyclohydrolase
MLNSDTYRIKNAIISVTDKTGIVDFSRELAAMGVELYSTGGTMKAIADAGIPVKSVSDITSFPEILDGRVKTLHPAIHSGILARLDEPSHLEQLAEHKLNSIDMVIVNLYPFEQALKSKLPHPEMVENIDIGGPTMLRSAAKNYQWTAPVVDPSKYAEIIELMKANDGAIPESYRVKLAGEVFQHTAYYDSLISGYFSNYNNIEFPERFAIPMKSVQDLRYGENPHQSAHLYGSAFNDIFKQLHGKELSYNNIVDIDNASRLILEFEEPAVAIIKHTNPCGCAIGDNLKDAYLKAFATDNVSPYGGIIAFNRKLDVETVEEVNKIFTEVIIAPDIEPEALELLRKKKDRRLIVADFAKMRDALGKEYKSVAGGFLVQSTDIKMVSAEELQVVSSRKPTDDEIKVMLFAWKIVKHVKSNAIVYTAADRTLGIGCGQMSRVDSARIGAEKAAQMGLSLQGCVVASDAFFPFADGVEQAASVGATCVIQPGGSIRDADAIAAADKHNLAMVFTGNRHFKH